MKFTILKLLIIMLLSLIVSPNSYGENMSNDSYRYYRVDCILFSSPAFYPMMFWRKFAGDRNEKNDLKTSCYAIGGTPVIKRMYLLSDHD